jgi:hypothetical protein
MARYELIRTAAGGLGEPGSGESAHVVDKRIHLRLRREQGRVGFRKFINHKVEQERLRSQLSMK